MENQNTNPTEERWAEWEKSHRKGKIFGGLLIVAVGVVFLAKELGANIPHWVISWGTFLMAIGLLMGVKRNFKTFGWLFPFLVGSALLMGELNPDFHIKLIIWPIILIVFGLFVMFKPRRRFRGHYWQNMEHRRHFQKHYHCFSADVNTNEDYIDSTSFMGGVKKNIVSKDFKGGDITNVFGGAELNLSQADFTGTATLEITQVFGGTKLIIPSHWEIKSELTTVMGSIEDKRQIQPNVVVDNSKVLILRGTTFFGGIDIKSF